ncbi:hypothetical protein SAMD00023353_5300060 [Rosellinia necatrix]|uniref:Uncharacterized protein n=1 Tax=Rosellinia necatrix TaxID=77044 RepID=A0A1S8AA84_ROSNE|nr:hypothetical protein SAMD00023353_5300060 [Rosellinia necatrix]
MSYVYILRDLSKAERLTPYIRGHSIKDYHRMFVVFKQFMKRRRANKFKLTAPDRNYAAKPLCWYPTSAEGEPGLSAGLRPGQGGRAAPTPTDGSLGA